MLHRTKPSKKQSSLVWKAAYLLVATMGIYSIYLAWVGLRSGSIANFSRFNHGLIALIDQPVAFWVAFSLWIVGGIFMVGLSVYCWYNAST